MTQKGNRRAQSDVRDLATTIGSDWRILATHLNDLWSLLLTKKRVRIVARVGVALLCTLVLLAVRYYYDNQPIVGDQPHYVLMEYSLVHDHDFNLGNNFAHHDSNTFGIYPPNGLTADGQVGPGQAKTPDHQYSIHGIGLPLLLWPGYLLHGAAGMEAEMIVVGVGVLFLAYYWTKILTKSVKLSLLAGVVLFASYVFYGLVGYIFPDMAIGAVILASLMILLTRADSVLWQMVLGALLGFSVFLHYKMLAFAAVVFLVLCYQTWTKRRTLPYVAAIPLVVLTAAFFYLTHLWFGLWNPSGIIADLNVGLHPEALLRNTTAILFDSARGFIPNNPIFVLLFVGLPIWFYKSRRTLIIALLCIAPQVATFVMFNDWRGGDSPAGRYIMNFLPVLMPALAFAVMYLRKVWQQLIVGLLFVVTALITLYYVRIRLGWLGVDSPISSPILGGTPLAFDRWFPQFDVATYPTGHADWLKALCYYAVLLGLMVYGWRLVTAQSAKRAPAKK